MAERDDHESECARPSLQPLLVTLLFSANQQHGTHGGGVRPDQDEGHPILAD